MRSARSRTEGETDVNYDGQELMRENGEDTGRVLLICPDAHEWPAVASGDDISYGISNPFAPRTSRVPSGPVTPEASG